MSMIEVKTAGLIGPALDWAVAKAVPLKHWPVVINGNVFLDTDYEYIRYSPSTDWSQGGPLIVKYQIGLLSPAQSPCGEWHASTRHPDLTDFTHKDNPLIAACRAIVAAKLGDVVRVPAELVNWSAP